MLDAHTHLAIPPETNFLHSLRRRCVAGKINPNLAARVIARSMDWSSFHMDKSWLPDSLKFSHSTVLGDFLRAFYASYASRFGKVRWGDKTPSYLLRMEELSAILPEARFIHIIRDCRDVVVSMRPLWFSPSREPQEIARMWVDWIREGRAQAARISHYLEVRYEDLVVAPERELRRICEFIELEYEPEMLAYSARAAERLSELGPVYRRFGDVLVSAPDRRQIHSKTSEAPLASQIGRWRLHLTLNECRAIESVAGPMMRELRYMEAESP